MSEPTPAQLADIERRLRESLPGLEERIRKLEQAQIVTRDCLDLEVTI